MRSIYKNRTRSKNRKTSKSKLRIKRNKYSKKKKYSKKVRAGSALTQNISLNYLELREFLINKDLNIVGCINSNIKEVKHNTECPSGAFNILYRFDGIDNAQSYALRLFKSLKPLKSNRNGETAGNMSHFSLQKIIENKGKNSDNSDNSDVVSNFYICKIFGYGILDKSSDSAPKLFDTKNIVGSQMLKPEVIAQTGERYLELVPGLPFSIIEKLNGGDLFDLMYKNTITLKHRLIILKQIATALNFIHESGYIYYDLKPENIGLKNIYFPEKEEEPEIRLLDFGMLFNTGTDVVPPDDRGTEYYNAPELKKRIRSDEGISNKVDVWSFGIVALKIYLKNSFGDRDSRGDTFYISDFDKYLEETTFEENSLELHIAILINCCLQNDPEKRLSFDEILNGKKITTKKYDRVFKVNTTHTKYIIRTSYKKVDEIQIGKKNTNIKGLLEILEALNPSDKLLLNK